MPRILWVAMCAAGSAARAGRLFVWPWQLLLIPPKMEPEWNPPSLPRPPPRWVEAGSRWGSQPCKQSHGEAQSFEHGGGGQKKTPKRAHGAVPGPRQLPCAGGARFPLVQPSRGCGHSGWHPVAVGSVWQRGAVALCCGALTPCCPQQRPANTSASGLARWKCRVAGDFLPDEVL